jgi:UMP-CMP kinase
MQKNGWEKKKFLIDGFPRNEDNYRGWYDVLGDSVTVPFIIFFEASEETMQTRIMARGQTSGRNDDNVEILKKRFNTFLEETVPIVEKYKLEDKVRCINAEFV